MSSEPLAWRKGSKSQGSGGNCVEAGMADQQVFLRDSKAPQVGNLALSRNDFAALADSVKLEALRT